MARVNTASHGSGKASRRTKPDEPRDPTLREMRATLQGLHYEIDNHGSDSQTGRLASRAYDHMAWLLDAYMFDVDDTADDGGRS